VPASELVGIDLVGRAQGGHPLLERGRVGLTPGLGVASLCQRPLGLALFEVSQSGESAQGIGHSNLRWGSFGPRRPALEADLSAGSRSHTAPKVCRSLTDDSRMNTLPWLLRLVLVALLVTAGPAWAQEVVPSLGEAIEGAVVAAPDEATDASVRLVLMLTALSLLPGLLLAMTPFTRFVIVFSLLRQALGLQQSPPNQILVGLSLALSMLVMQPTLQEVWDDGASPYMEGEITTMEAYERSMTPMRTFMLRNVQRDDLATAMRLSRMPKPNSLDEVPTPVVVTGFVLSELRTAFVIAVKIYVPFLVVDLVVASTLLGMGMMMLPPVVISLPFKLMVFVLMDGWGLLVTGMVAGIH